MRRRRTPLIGVLWYIDNDVRLHKNGVPDLRPTRLDEQAFDVRELLRARHISARGIDADGQCSYGVNESQRQPHH